MKGSELIKRMIRNYFYIFGCIMFLITILRQIFKPESSYDLKTIYIIMLFSLLSSIPGAVLLGTNKKISEMEMRIRAVIHFTLLELILVVLAWILGYVTDMVSGIVMASEVAIVYGMVRVLLWKSDKKSADLINEKLKEQKHGN